MLCSNRNILETLAVLRGHGVRDFVVCPGSRNAGIVHSACQITDFRTHSVTDERSAGFMAIGISLATRRPVAVVVTSGSALANLYPSACEAFYQHLPIVYISADRQASWIGQMDGQTMPQEGALGKMVKMCINLPEDNLWHANRLLNEAMLSCKERLPQGPVHINIPISEPIYDFATETLPLVRIIHYADGLSENAVPIGKHSLLIIGQLQPHEVPEHSILKQLSAHITIIAENLSNIPSQFCTNPSNIDWEKMPSADTVITIGGHIINKNLKHFFRNHQPQEHWHVSPDGAVADLFCCQTLAIKADTKAFLHSMACGMTTQDTPIALPTKENCTASRLQLMEEFFSLIPADAIVHLANSSTVRLAQTAMKACNASKSVKIFCNRGINGIEGSLSTAVGYAKACPESPTYLITGDLSFFYDQNALWCYPLPNNLHILLFNDGHGGIFNSLPLPTEPQQSIDAITGTHRLCAKHIAQHYGIRYYNKRDKLMDFINAEETTILEIYETMENS